MDADRKDITKKSLTWGSWFAGLSCTAPRKHKHSDTRPLSWLDSAQFSTYSLMAKMVMNVPDKPPSVPPPAPDYESTEAWLVLPDAPSLLHTLSPPDDFASAAESQPTVNAPAEASANGPSVKEVLPPGLPLGQRPLPMLLHVLTCLSRIL